MQICLFMIDFFHSAEGPQDSSMLQRVRGLPSFKRLNTIPLCVVLVFPRETELILDIDRWGDLLGNQLMWLQRLSPPAELHPGDPGKLVHGSVQSQRPENPGGCWCKSQCPKARDPGVLMPKGRVPAPGGRGNCLSSSFLVLSLGPSGLGGATHLEGIFPLIHQSPLENPHRHTQK